MTFIDEILHTLGILFVFLLVLVIIAASEHWYVPSAVCLIFAIVVYPILCHFETRRFYARLFQERNAGEIRRSLILLFGSAAVLIALFWGALGSELTVIAAILAWGLGDEAAVTEAVTKKGYDTVTVPFVTAAVIQILLTL